MFKKFFTLKEANSNLPHIKKVVGDILEKGQKLKSLIPETRDERVALQCEHLTNEINGRMQELEDMGCYFKDWNFEVGLVDFPAMVDGQEVFLCWKSDEGEILWYHGIEDGYSGRRPLPAEWLVGGS